MAFVTPMLLALTLAGGGAMTELAPHRTVRERCPASGSTRWS